jgi:hypothetical protein
VIKGPANTGLPIWELWVLVDWAFLPSSFFMVFKRSGLAGYLGGMGFSIYAFSVACITLYFFVLGWAGLARVV